MATLDLEMGSGYATSWPAVAGKYRERATNAWRNPYADEFEVKEGEIHWCVGLGSFGAVQGGGADG